MSAFNISRNVAAVLALLLAATPVSALDPDRFMSQYLRDEWGPARGYTGGSVYGFAQTPDGYLWIASDNGITRFDGVKFEALPLPASATVGGPTALGVAASDDGKLWLRMRGRTLVGYRDGVFEDLMAAHGQTQGTIYAMSSQPGGDVLIAGFNNGVLRFHRGQLETVVPPRNMPNTPVTSIADTIRGVFLGTRDAGIFKVTGATVEHVASLLSEETINCLLGDPSGDVWIGTDRGIARLTNAGIERVALPQDLRGVAALSLLRDHESNLWVAAAARGVIRINRTGAALLPDWDARKSGAATALYEDREHNLWVGTTRGVDRLRDGIFATYSGFSELPSDQIGPIAVDGQDRAWFASTRGGLCWLQGDRPHVVDAAALRRDVVYSLDARGDEVWIGRQYGGLTHLLWVMGNAVTATYTEKNGLAQSSVFAVHASPDGSVWAGTLSGGVSHFQHGRFETYTVRDGLASNTVSALAESQDGTMWFGSPEGLTRLSETRWRTYLTGDGLPSNKITALAVRRDGTLLIGTASGLALLRSGRDAVIETVPAVRDSVVGLAEDRSGGLWCATTDRLLRLSGDDVREFDAADGLISRQSVSRYRTLVADARGRIWYATNDGLSVADPLRFESTSLPAPVRINSVSIDDSVRRSSGELAIPSSHRRIVLSYTAVSLSIPERIRYRYHLDGFDRGWSTPSTERTAVYTNLAPAHYVFHVLASDSNGRWSGPEQTLEFDVLPAVWQTGWFRIAALFTVITAIALAFRLRMAHMSRQLNVRFEERFAERNRIAQELHDTLLQGFIGASMQLHTAVSRLPSDSPLRSQLAYVFELMQRVIADGRRAIHGLRSPGHDLDDLRIALERIARDVEVQGEPRVQVSVRGEPQAVHPVVRDEVYRIGREALANAVHHSQARNIDVELAYDPHQLVLTVRDDGIGIDDQVATFGRDGHWGLSGMRERADAVGGRLALKTGPADGTAIEVSIPGTIAFGDRAKTKTSWWKS